MSGRSPLLSRSVNSPAIWPSRVSTEGDEDAPLGGERGCNEVSRIVAPPLTLEREITEKTSHALNTEQNTDNHQTSSEEHESTKPEKAKKKGPFFTSSFRLSCFRVSLLSVSHLCSIRGSLLKARRPRCRPGGAGFAVGAR